MTVRIGLLLLAFLVTPGRPGAAGTVPAPPAAEARSAPDRGEAYTQYLLYRHHQLQRDIGGALSALRAALAADPDSAYLRFVVATHLLDQGQVAEAIATAEAGVARDPDLLQLHVLLGAEIYYRLAERGRLDAQTLDRGLHHLRECIRLDPNNPVYYFRGSRLYRFKGEYREALRLIQRSEAQAANDPDLLHYTAGLFLDARDPAGAEAFLEQALATFPDSLTLRHDLAEARWDRGRRADAYVLFTALIQEAEQEPQATEVLALALINRGRTHYLWKRTAEAQADFAYALQLNPDAPIPYYFLFKIALDRADHAEADRYLEEMDRRFEFNVPLLQAEAHYQRRQDREGRAVLLQYLEEGGDPRRIIGAFADAGRFDAAVGFVERHLKSRLSRQEYLFVLGQVLERDGNLIRSERALRKALLLAPENAEILNCLGYMLADNNTNLKDALWCLEKAVALEPENGAYLDSLGWAYFRLGRLALAERYLKQALEQSQAEPVILSHMGDVAYARGDRRAALEYYEQALAFGLEENLKRIQDRVATLRQALAGPASRPRP